MAYTKTIWQDRYIETPNKYQMVQNQDDTVTLTEVTGTIYTDGTEVNAEHMNNLENGVEDADNRVTALEQDTGWQDISYASGFTAGTGGQLQYRKVGNVVYIRGGASGTFPTGFTTVNSVMLPEQYRPSVITRVGASASGGRAGAMEVTTLGEIRFAHQLSSAPTWMGTTISYPLN